MYQPERIKAAQHQKTWVKLWTQHWGGSARVGNEIRNKAEGGNKRALKLLFWQVNLKKRRPAMIPERALETSTRIQNSRTDVPTQDLGSMCPNLTNFEYRLHPKFQKTIDQNVLKQVPKQRFWSKQVTPLETKRPAQHKVPDSKAARASSSKQIACTKKNNPRSQSWQQVPGPKKGASPKFQSWLRKSQNASWNSCPGPWFHSRFLKARVDSWKRVPQFNIPELNFETGASFWNEVPVPKLQNWFLTPGLGATENRFPNQSLV